MRTTNTFGIQFITRPNKIRDEMLPIYVRITIDSKRVEISLKRYVLPSEWNSTKGMVRGNRDTTKSLNHYIEEVRSKIVACYQEMQIKKQLITAVGIKNQFLGVNQKDYTLCKLVDYHNTNQKDLLASGTMKNYYTTQKYIESFLREKRKTSDIFLSELTYKFITDFEHYLRNYKPVDHHRPLSNNGTMKHIERFRKMINLAVKLDWLDKDPFVHYKQKFEKFERGFLTKEELQRIETKEFKIPRLQLARDLFVFSCYTGLAYIDVMKLVPSNIIVGNDNEYWMITRRQKTSNPVRVPLLPKATEILNRYKANLRAQASGMVFPIISNQKLNSYLKEISNFCGINKNLTFHLARHTFATTITLTNGVPIESVSKMLGHSKITTTQIYAKVIEKKLSEDMMNLRAKLEN